MPDDNKIFGMTWDQIRRLQQKQGRGMAIDVKAPGDYGADPVGNGTFRMVPSGDVVDLPERNRRLAR